MNNDYHTKKADFISPRKIFLAFGLLLIGAGLLFFALREFRNGSSLAVLRTFFLFIIGGFLFYRAMTRKKVSSIFFISLVILLNGFLLILIDLGLLAYRLVQVWPIMVMISGLALIPTSMYKEARLTSRFLVPSIMIFSMGVFFLLFSFDIITVSFVVFASQWWPLFFILGGLSLIGLFFYGKKKDAM